MIGAGSDVGSLLVDGLGDGLLLEAAGQDFEFLRNTSFNLLQGCRMRNTKTVFLYFDRHLIFYIFLEKKSGKIIILVMNIWINRNMCHVLLVAAHSSISKK